MRAYLMWNLSVIPNSVTIVSAYQKLYTVGGANVGNPFMIGVYNTSLYNMTGNGPWVEGTVNGGDVGTLSDLTQNLTWKNQPYNSMTLQNTTRPSMATGTYEFNITNATISTYANSTNKNMSILMKGVTETNNTQNRYCFYSKELGVDSQEPQLVITYQTYQICTGGWVNDTWTPITGTGNWSNVTKTVNSTVGVNVSWCFYANDTLGMWNHSCSSPFEYITTTGAQFYSGNVTASITIENFASRFGVLARNAMQSLGIDAITTRINAFFVTIYDLLTMNALASRLVAFVRSIVQAVTANAFISKAMSLFRAFGQEIAFNPDASAAETGYPEYWGNSTNSTVVESDIEHRLGWNDTVGMSGYVFQFCEGVWNGTDCPCAVEP